MRRMAAISTDLTPAETFRHGILAARDERWRDALELLTRVAQRAEARGNMPGVFYSTLGVAIARCEGQRKEGLELGRYGVGLQPDEPDNHLNLATLYLLNGRRGPAIRAIERGLEIEPRHERLRAAQVRLGVRRRPPLPFLSRDNPLNVMIGQLRHRVMASVAARRRAREEERQEREALST